MTQHGLSPHKQPPRLDTLLMRGLIVITVCISVHNFFKHVYFYLKCGGNSLIDKKSGHTPNFEDLKTATPSELTLNDMLNC